MAVSSTLAWMEHGWAIQRKRPPFDNLQQRFWRVLPGRLEPHELQSWVQKITPAGMQAAVAYPSEHTKDANYYAVEWTGSLSKPAWTIDAAVVAEQSWKHLQQCEAAFFWLAKPQFDTSAIMRNNAIKTLDELMRNASRALSILNEDDWGAQRDIWAALLKRISWRSSELPTQIKFSTDMLKAFDERNWILLDQLAEVVNNNGSAWQLQERNRVVASLQSLVNSGSALRGRIMDEQESTVAQDPVILRELEPVISPSLDQKLIYKMKHALSTVISAVGERDRRFWVQPCTAAAILRALEVVGECAKTLSTEEKAKYPTVPWHPGPAGVKSNCILVDLRNLLHHLRGQVAEMIKFTKGICFEELLSRSFPALLQALNGQSSSVEDDVACGFRQWVRLVENFEQLKCFKDVQSLLDEESERDILLRTLVKGPEVVPTWEKFWDIIRPLIQLRKDISLCEARFGDAYAKWTGRRVPFDLYKSCLLYTSPSPRD